MKHSKMWTLSLILILRCLAFAQSKSGDVEQTIRSLETQMTEAALKGDLAASEKYLASDYVRVYPDGSVAPTDDLRNSLKFTSIEISDQQVHLTGDTAVSIFKASVKASINGQPIEGDFRGVRTWAKERGEWKAVAYSSTKIEQRLSAAPPPSSAPEQRVHVKENVLVSDDLPKLKLTLDPKFQYLGSFAFDIRGIAGGYRYIWGETDHGKHLRRAFIVQAEGFYPNNDGSYQYGTPNPATLAGDAYQHNVWIYDNDQSALENPGNESDLTKQSMRDHGYEWEPQLIMSRFARVVDESRKNEIIFFYFENLKDYTPKRVMDFPEEATGAEQKAILDSVDANSRKAFIVAH